MGLFDSKEKKFLKACESGDLEYVTKAIEIDKTLVDVRKKDDYSTPLMHAISNGHEDLVKLLIKSGANVNTKDDFGKTVLMYACDSEKIDVVKLVLSKGVDIDQKSTALHRAANRGNSEIVRLLIENGANAFLMEGDKFLDDVVMQAGYKDVAKLLREARAEQGKLIRACESGTLDEVKQLVESGFDLEIKNENGETALMVLLLNPFIYDSNLNKFVMNFDKAKYLLEKGANIDAKDKDGNTALIGSCGEGILPIVYFILEHGANVNETNNDGTTALFKACILTGEDKTSDKRRKIRVEIAEMLIEHGADVNIHEPGDGDTVLIRACLRNYSEMVKMLVEHGADVNATDKEGFDPLMVVAQSEGSFEIAKTLIEHGANIYREAITPRGRSTALGLAKRFGNTDVANLITFVMHNY